MTLIDCTCCTKEEEENGLSSSKRRLDFLDIVLKARDEDGNGLTDLEIRNEVDTFLFAGNRRLMTTNIDKVYEHANVEHLVGH